VGYVASVVRRWPCVCALLMGAALPAVAQAEEKARFVYVRGAGAEACPGEVDLRLWVMARLGYDPFSPQASRAVIARVEAREHQLFSSVEVADPEGLSTGRRELSSKNESCQELARAMALSISLAIDPERASTPQTAPVAAPPPPAAPAPPPVLPARAPEPPVPKQRVTPSHAFVSGALETGVGQLPGVALGAALGVGWRSRVASFALEGRGAFSLGDYLTPRGRLTGSLLLGGIAGCAHLGAIGVCAVGYVGQQRLGTQDVAQPNTSSALSVEFGPRVTLELPLARRLPLTMAVEAVLNATRNRALLTGREVWKAPIVGAALSVGVSAHFL
jgi:hypothetical protein